MTKDWKERLRGAVFVRTLNHEDGFELEDFIESNFVPKLEHQTKLALAKAQAM